MHGRFRPQITEHPLHIAGRRDPARATRIVANFQDRIFDRVVERHVDRQRRMNPCLAMLKDADAEAVTAHVRRGTPAGEWCGRPVMTSLFVAQIERFAARVTHRVVVPRRQAVLVGVFAPGVGDTIFGDDAAEMRIGQHIHPWRGRGLGVRGGDDVFAAIFAKAAEAVVEL